MEYNFELQKLYENFGNHILISLCKDYNNYFSFNEGNKSKLSKHLNLYRFSEIIETVCYSLIRNGKYKLHYVIEQVKNKSVIKFYIKDIANYDKISFSMPKTVMTNKVRKKILKKLKYLNYNKMISKNSGDINKVKLLGEMQKNAVLKIGKMCNPFYINNFTYFDYYTDYYCIYRKAENMIYQRKLVDYVLNEINKTLSILFNLDEKDKINFNGISIIELEDIIADLKEYKTPLPDITTKLYQKEQIK